MSKDPYKYFRLEARELLDNLSRGILELEKNGVQVDQLTNMLRYAHTLKGAARVVKQLEISQNAHTIEGMLLSYKSGEVTVPKEKVSELLSLVDKATLQLNTLQEQQVPGATMQRQTSGQQVRSTSAEDIFDTVRIDISEMDSLLNGLSQAAVHVCSLRAMGLELEALLPLRGHLRKLFSRIESAEKELKVAKERASALRLLPANTIFSTLQRSIRDAAESMKKKIDFESFGGETRLDAHILRIMKDSLIHVVRNAVAHGIENVDERLSLGKADTGKIKLQVERRGNKVAFTVSDDGRGIDIEAIRKVAIHRGLITGTEAQTFDYPKAIHLILQGGVSTAGVLSEVTGRGVGLGVLQDAITKMKGTIDIRSEPHVGMTIDICVPINVESLKVITVKVNGLAMSLPLDIVKQTLKVSSGDLVRSSGGDSLVIDDHVVPFYPLPTILGIKSRFFERASSFVCLVVPSGKNQIALGVERIERVEEVMMRPLSSLVGRIPLVVGACLDMDGNPQLVLDTQGLNELVFKTTYSFNVKDVEKRRVMVVDDSLTTRMLEKSILDSAGYDVTLVNSGEEAIEQAKRDTYSIFIVDVEMPGMDGFELISKLREDPNLQSIPAILVTSRGGNEDRKRGESVGAQAYILKSEFDETSFLKTIRKLVG